jgi:hypothetical protein
MASSRIAVAGEVWVIVVDNATDLTFWAVNNGGVF